MQTAYRSSMVALAAAAAMASLPSAFGAATPRLKSGPGYSHWLARNRKSPPQSRSRWSKPHQGARECERRRRQMANHTHGY